MQGDRGQRRRLRPGDRLAAGSAWGYGFGSFSASSIEDWRRSIESWLARPTDNRVLIAISILLDGRSSTAERGLDVKRLLFETGDRSSLERWMLRLALAAKPPTGFMHDIVVEASGSAKGTFDIKHAGLLPIVDLARYAALMGASASPPRPTACGPRRTRES